jgi:hypothetical protein
MPSRDSHSSASRIGLGTIILGIVIIEACAARGHVEPPAADASNATTPASRGLVTSHVVDFIEVERTLSRGATGDTTERESVRTTVEERLVPLADGGRGLMRISSGHYAAGDFTDTLVMHRDGLAPVWERLRYPQQRYAKEIEYGDASLHQVNRLGDSTQSFQKRFTLPVFAFSEVDLVVRSLPYASGYRTILPLYSEGDDSLEMDTVAVVGRAGHGWTVRFADPAIVATYVIDSTLRRVTQYDVMSRRNGAHARRVVSEGRATSGGT